MPVTAGPVASLKAREVAETSREIRVMARILLTAALDRIRLGSLIQMLLTEGISCTAVIRQTVEGVSNAAGTTEKAQIEGSIGIQEGLLSGARLHELSGEDALLSLMMWGEGELTVTDTLMPGAGFMAMDPLSLMLEALRLQDHWDDLGDRLLVCTKPALATDELSALLVKGLTVAEAALALKAPPIRLISKLEALLEDGIFARGRHQKDKAALKSLALRLPWLATPVESPVVSEAPSTSARSGAATPAPAESRSPAVPRATPANRPPTAPSPVESVTGIRAAILKATSRGVEPPAGQTLPIPARTQLPMGLIAAQGPSPLATTGNSPSTSPPPRLDLPREASFGLFRRTENEPPLRPTGGDAFSSGTPAAPPSGPAVGAPAEPESSVETIEETSARDTAFYQLVDRGRQAFKRNALDEAEALWTEATRLRPEDRTLRQNMRILQLKKSQNGRGTA